MPALPHTRCHNWRSSGHQGALTASCPVPGELPAAAAAVPVTGVGDATQHTPSHSAACAHLPEDCRLSLVLSYSTLQHDGAVSTALCCMGPQHGCVVVTMVVYKGLSSPQTMLFVGQVPRGGPPCSVPHTCLPPSLHPIHPYTTARAVLTLGKHTMAKVNMMGGSTQQQDACQVEEPPLKEEVTPPWVSTVAAVDTQQQRLGDTGGRPNARRGNTHTTLGSVYRWPLRTPLPCQVASATHSTPRHRPPAQKTCTVLHHAHAHAQPTASSCRAPHMRTRTWHTQACADAHFAAGSLRHHAPCSDASSTHP